MTRTRGKLKIASVQLRPRSAGERQLFGDDQEYDAVLRLSRRMSKYERTTLAQSGFFVGDTEWRLVGPPNPELLEQTVDTLNGQIAKAVDDARGLREKAELEDTRAAPFRLASRVFACISEPFRRLPRSAYLIFFAALPWIILALPQHASWSILLVNGALVVCALGLAWLLVYARQIIPMHGFVLFSVLGCMSNLLGDFAVMYYALRDSFTPALTSRIEAVYFTVSTATTTGMADMHPSSGTARMLVAAQMILSAFVVVTVIGVALQRILSAATQDFD